MSRSFVLSLKKPQETLGIAQPLSVKMLRGRHGLATLLLACLGFVCLVFSILSVNASASKAYTIRTLEKQAERLREQVSYLESQAALAQSYSSLQERVRDLGYIPVEQVNYIE